MTSKRQVKRRRQAKGRSWRRLNPLYALIPTAAVLLVVGIWFLAGSAGSPGVSAVPVGSEDLELPAWVVGRGPQVEHAYTEAVAHRDDLRYIPCYCGCGREGHTSVADCFVADVAADGSITFDDHAST